MADIEPGGVGAAARRGRRGRAGDRDWTKGSIIGSLFLLSWPMLVSRSLESLGPTIDMVWVGRLGAAPIAGVGVAMTAGMLLMAGRMGLDMGTRAMIARFYGAGDTSGANHVARQAFVISSIYAIVMATIGIFFAERILLLLGLEPDVLAEGSAYLRVLLVGSAAMSFRMMCDGIMQASGDAVTPMKINIFLRFVHVGLCPFLVFGWWIFPFMGASGAAMTNIVSQSLGTAVGLWVLFTGRSRLRLTVKGFRLDPNIIWRIVRIGIPPSVDAVQRSLSRLILMTLIIPFGTFAVAAYTLCMRIEMVLRMSSLGLGMGAGVLVGQNLGARQPERAEKSGWLGTGFIEVIMVIASVAIFLWAEAIIGIFSTDRGVMPIASAFIRIGIAAYLVMGFSMVLWQCLMVAGDTLPPMIIGIVTMWAVQLPLAYLLPRVTGLGVYGVRWAMVVGMVLGAVAYTAYFKLGRWKRKRV